LVGLLGMLLLGLGFAFFILFRIALRTFDHSLKSELAAQGRDQVERAAMKIQNRFVRRMVLNHLVATGGTLAVSVVRGAIQSRMRTALYLAILGAALLVLSFSAGLWWPLIWPGGK